MSSSPPLPYIQRIREYYQALGYGTSYKWAHFNDVPFSKPTKPVAESRLTIVTTAAPFQPGSGDQGPGAPYNGAAKFFSVYSQATNVEPDLCISHVAIDRMHTTAEDQNSYFPLKAFRELHENGKLGAITPRFHGLPTNRSQRITLEIDCVELLRRCREDRVDIAVLVPNCPVCHQSITHAARTLEQAGISTVIFGAAHDDRRYPRPDTGTGGDIDGHHGLRQRYRRACRRTKIAVQRFSARQCGRPARGSGSAIDHRADGSGFIRKRQRAGNNNPIAH